MNPSHTDVSIAAVAGTSGQECDFVRQWLREHNWKENPRFMELLQQPEHEAQSLVLLANGNSCVVGGLFAETQFAWLRISILSVKPDWRSRGIGTNLLAEAERRAISRGCKHVYVDTMDYQAPRFYLKNGFEMVGQIPDWDSQGHNKLFFCKSLNGSI